MTYTVTMPSLNPFSSGPTVTLLIKEDDRDFCYIEGNYDDAKRRAGIILEALNAPKTKKKK